MKAPETAEDFSVTVFHNPACGTSRKTLETIRAAGCEPTVVEYLKTGWTRTQLRDLFAAMGVRPRDMIRETGSPAAELGLLEPSADDEAILDAMVAHPILVNRPIVVTPLGTRLTRPAELVLPLLARRPPGAA